MSAEQQIEKIAYQIYINRQIRGQHGDANRDWSEAELIYNRLTRRFFFLINQMFVRTEKQAIEPLADWVDRADLFRIVERISPVVEAIGILAIPIVLFLATQIHQEGLRQQEIERVQQQSVRDYLSQLYTVFSETEGTLREPKKQRLRSLTEANTLAILAEPNLDGVRKGEIISFLYRTDLIKNEFVYGPSREEDRTSVLELHYADLNNAALELLDLSSINFKLVSLRDANLYQADLTNADLSGANLRNANLIRADLGGVDLHCVDLIPNHSRRPTRIRTCSDMRGANLSNADLSNAKISGIRLEGANLSGVDLRGTNFFCYGSTNQYGATASVASCPDLDDTNLSYTNLDDAINIIEGRVAKGLLCRTSLPPNFNLDPNRDCKKLGINPNEPYFVF